MNYPSHLLDELGRIFAKVALERLIKDAMATLPELQGGTNQADIPPSVDAGEERDVDGLVSDESSD